MLAWGCACQAAMELFSRLENADGVMPASSLYQLHAGDSEGFLGALEPGHLGEIEASAWLGFYKELQDHIGPDATEAFLCHLLEAPAG